MNNECPFCSYETASRVVEKGKFSYVIMSDPRLAVGHLLVIPNRHVNKLSELNHRENQEIFKLLANYQEKLLAQISSGIEIRQNFKPYFPNSKTHVNHLHFHIIPRSENDEISIKLDPYRKPLYRDLSEKERKEISKLLE